jgi:hypothetical protein
MHFAIAAAAVSVAALVSATPIKTRQVQLPDTVYGVDPSKPFYLSAYNADQTSSYILQPFYVDYTTGVLGLQAVLEGGPLNASSPRANFTLTGNHYGTQLYAYETGPCTSAASCDETPLQWSNDEPEADSLLTFHLGIDEPTFGGLNFYGAYRGGDFEAGESNYLVGQSDADLTKAFSVCDWDVNTELQVLAYHGTNTSCVAVTVNAYQAPGY